MRPSYPLHREQGIIVVQLMPVVMEFRRPVSVHALMFAIMELSRGNSDRLPSRSGRRRVARKHASGSRVVTRRLTGLDPVRRR